MTQQHAEPDVSPTPPQHRATFRPRHRFTAVQIVVGLFAFLLLVIVVFGAGLYRGWWSGATIDRIVSFVPYPIARVEWNFIPFRPFNENVATLRHFYARQAPPNGQPDDAFLMKTMLTKLIRDRWLEASARRVNVAVGEDEIDAEYAKIVEQSGGSSVAEQNIRELYDWGPAEFKVQVVRPYLLRRKLQDRLSSDPSFDASIRTRAEAVLEKARAGEDFAALARQFSEDATAGSGGDLGFFSSSEMVPEFQAAVEQLKPGEVSGLVRTQYGYHIIKLEEERTQDGKEQWRARHILIKAADVDSWLNGTLAKEMVVVFLRGFRWDSSCTSVLATGETCPSA